MPAAPPELLPGLEDAFKWYGRLTRLVTYNWNTTRTCEEDHRAKAQVPASLSTRTQWVRHVEPESLDWPCAVPPIYPTFFLRGALPCGVNVAGYLVSGPTLCHVVRVRRRLWCTLPSTGQIRETGVYCVVPQTGGWKNNWSVAQWLEQQFGRL